ncbi:MAG: HAD-IA family hydrolase [Spirosomataceae bacterium]|jgi:3-deoxy-D-manno-octulosonate 8-phosphate phosphatase (KDO 8-P phosphatase)
MDIKIKEKISKINTFVFDVDGVFTDGSILVGESDIQRTFSVRDGYAVQMAANQGYKMAVISGGKQESIRKRLTGLGIKDVFLAVGTDQKPVVFEKFLNDNDIKEDEVLYIGDDIPDLLLMQKYRVFSCCPQDSSPEVLETADYICEKSGGKGAVREVIELVMKYQKTWMKGF